ncbi:TetR/AcrR family transcriptional regulator [Streptomyces fuscigenes]|uniref:TetR/AcrR family transcriptional regulator n=1 Tax=Streptomyces fuscigenes TaxID=1528880 RepID=UPI001F3E3680|nr:TetR/AcrR family transcriptional regulator [Streptomyces fuscigenes]MCF3961814.1 TetR/AcrR family transcriptional regulator [Streptomyces fuscigenes]
MTDTRERGGGGDGGWSPALALLWGTGRPVGRRGPRPTLTLDAIARAGVAVADAEGLAALTMQRTAAEVGVTKMALYRYVPGKDELVALMIEAAMGEPPRDAAPKDAWRPRLDAWARGLFERFVRHSWALEAIVGPRPMGPHELAWMEAAVAALAGCGLGGGERLDVAATLVGHVRAVAQQHAAVAGGGAEEAMAEGIAPLLAARREQFPALAEAFASAAHEGSGGDALDFGLARILDGVELLVNARREAAPGE